MSEQSAPETQAPKKKVNRRKVKITVLEQVFEPPVESDRGDPEDGVSHGYTETEASVDIVDSDAEELKPTWVETGKGFDTYTEAEAWIEEHGDPDLLYMTIGFWSVTTPTVKKIERRKLERVR